MFKTSRKPARGDRPRQPDPFDRLPPHSLEAEMCVLGSMMLDPTNVIPDVMGQLGTTDFYEERHRTLFDAVLDVFTKRGTLDLVLMSDHLRAEGAYDPSYLEELVNAVPSAATWHHYAKIVRERSMLRRVIDICGTAIFDAYRHTDDPGDLIADAARKLADLRGPAGAKTLVSLGEVTARLIDRLSDGCRETVESGLPAYDQRFGGLPKSGVVCIAGYPSGGKTTLALLFARRLATYAAEDRTRGPVIVCSYEQGAARADATILTQETGVPVHALLNTGHEPSGPDIDKLADAHRAHAGLPFYLATDNMSPEALQVEVSRYTARGLQGGVLVVDYIQDVPPGPDPRQSRNDRIAEAMRVLAEIARRHSWLVLVLSQLSKDATKENRRPQISDGLGSSSIEQRSDTMLYIWRPHQREQPPAASDTTDAFGHNHAAERCEARRKRCEIGVVKNKFGATGSIEVVFEPSILSFREAKPDDRIHWGRTE